MVHPPALAHPSKVKKRVGKSPPATPPRIVALFTEIPSRRKRDRRPVRRRLKPNPAEAPRMTNRAVPRRTAEPEREPTPKRPSMIETRAPSVPPMMPPVNVRPTVPLSLRIQPLIAPPAAGNRKRRKGNPSCLTETSSWI
jgi:hypothetical protein